jgi:hypothetical protein
MFLLSLDQSYRKEVSKQRQNCSTVAKCHHDILWNTQYEYCYYEDITVFIKTLAQGSEAEYQTTSALVRVLNNGHRHFDQQFFHALLTPKGFNDGENTITVAAMHERIQILAKTWHIVPDVAVPNYRASRVDNLSKTFWIFDLTKNHLVHGRRDGTGEDPPGLIYHMPLDEFITSKGGSNVCHKMQLYDPNKASMSLDEHLLELDINLSENHRRLINILLSKFNVIWKDALALGITESTALLLATGILNIATLDFDWKRSNSRDEHCYLIPDLKLALQIPVWKSRKYPIFSVRGVTVFVSFSVNEGLKDVLANLEIITQNKKIFKNIHADFLILARCQALFGKLNGESGNLLLTKPMELISGYAGPPLGSVTDTFATVFARPIQDAAIHRLPLELQDIILDLAGDCYLEKLHISSLLGIGSSSRMMKKSTISDWESKITFGGKPTGLDGYV